MPSTRLGSRAWRIELADAAGLDGRAVAQTTLAGLLHDVGKIGVPRVDPAQAGQRSTGPSGPVKRRHPETRAHSSPSARDLQPVIAPILRHHHERWDGAGYPDGLAGGGDPARRPGSPSRSPTPTTRLWPSALSPTGRGWGMGAVAELAAGGGHAVRPRCSSRRSCAAASATRRRYARSAFPRRSRSPPDRPRRSSVRNA